MSGHSKWSTIKHKKTKTDFAGGRGGNQIRLISKLLVVSILLLAAGGCTTPTSTDSTTTTTSATATTTTTSTTTAAAPRIVAVGDASSVRTIIYSDDYGATWSSEYSEAYRGDFNCVTYDSLSGNFYAAGYNGYILYSSSGTSWSSTSGVRPADGDFYGAVSDGQGELVVVGVNDGYSYDHGIVNYRNLSGSSYYNYLVDGEDLAGNSLNSGYLYGVAVDDNSRFVAVGKRYVDGGTISVARYSTDGGENWTEHNSNATVSLGTTVQLRDVAATESNTFYTVGNSGTVMLSSNGGSTWSSVSISAASGYTLYGIASDSNSSATTMVVVGSSGFLLRGTKSGSTWSWASVSSGTSAHLLDVATDGNGNWVAVGTGGKAIYSDDNAASWTAGVSGISRELYGVTFGD